MIYRTGDAHVAHDGHGDHTWITTLGGQLFADLGPYAWILREWLAQPGVSTWIDVDGDSARTTRRGFVMLAFYQASPVPGGPTVPVADVLALGVEPAQQGLGIGAGLLAHAIAAAGRAAAAQMLPALHLTVAADNLTAQRLYARAGFMVDGAPNATAEAYPSGVVALRMRRPLP